MGIITSFCISLMLFSKLYNQDAVSSWWIWRAFFWRGA
jgi:hypothetical protein